MNILHQANQIVNNRSEEKERMYGPFDEGMEKTALIASAMSNKIFSAKDIYTCLIALKLSRASYNYREDNYLDCVAYIGALNTHINKEIILEFLNDFIKKWDLSNDNEINALTEEYTIFLEKYNLPNLSAEDMIQEIKLNKISL
jgi:hypothetical protein